MQSSKRIVVSSKGQLVIPKEIRKEMDINKGDQLIMEIVDAGVLLRPFSKRKSPSRKLRGLLKGEDMDPDECETILEEAKKTLVNYAVDNYKQ